MLDGAGFQLGDELVEPAGDQAGDVGEALGIAQVAVDGGM
jgi:hypothetical protein